MNPIENESVVAELLRESDGSLELVDKRNDLPGLVARPGMSTWKVLSENKTRREVKDKMKRNNAKMQARRREWAENNSNDIESVQPENNDESNFGGDESQVPVSITTSYNPKSFNPLELKKLAQLAGLNEYTSFNEVPVTMQKRIRKSCFPPTAEEAARFNLEYCMRILPHDMNTGGFFVALLKKVAPTSQRAQRVFEKLERELEECHELPSGEEEPNPKRAKVDQDDENGAEASEVFHTGKSTEALPNEEQTPASMPGNVKKYYLSDKDGNMHPTLGRDDFVPLPNEIFEPLKGEFLFFNLCLKKRSALFLTVLCGENKNTTVFRPALLT